MSTSGKNRHYSSLEDRQTEMRKRQALRKHRYFSLLPRKNGRYVKF